MKSMMLNVAGNGYVRITKVWQEDLREESPSIVEKEIRTITKIID